MPKFGDNVGKVLISERGLDLKKRKEIAGVLKDYAFGKLRKEEAKKRLKEALEEGDESFLEGILWAAKYDLLVERKKFLNLRARLDRITNFYFVLYKVSNLAQHSTSSEEFIRALVQMFFHFPEFRFVWGRLEEDEAFLPETAEELKSAFPEEVFEDFYWTCEPRILRPKDISAELVEGARKLGIRRFVLIPLGMRGISTGMFILGLSKPPLTDWERTLFLEDLYTALNEALESIRERRIQNHNLFDPLTELPLEGYFLSLLEGSLREAKEKGEKVLVSATSVDHLIHVNQVFGFNVGDVLLREMAERLKGFVKRRGGEAGRGKSETFYFFIPRPEYERDFLEELKQELSQPVKVRGLVLDVTVSMGACLFPDDGKEAKDLLKKARTALHEAKRLGGNRIAFFHHDLHEKAKHYLILLPKLRRALKNNEFVVYCQPRIDLKEWRVCGGEILVRWYDPVKGLIPPAEFIWVLEESGLITDLGIWIAEETCKVLLSLPREVYVSLNLSFNVSPRQLWGSNFVDQFIEILKKYKLCPSRIKIEITENVFIERTEEIIRELQKISKAGVQVVLDDFGTGYSSLHYLSRLPVNDLKIDRAFVKGLPDSSHDLEIVKAILALARALEKRVIAEGVETEAQLKCLMDLGVDEVQGFYFSPPIPWEQFTTFIKTFDEKFGQKRLVKP